MNTKQKILTEEHVIKLTRQFFYERSFHEIIPTILNEQIPIEDTITPFKTSRYFLPTSPEKSLKHALAQGIGNCFAVGKSFRDLEQVGVLHQNEFIMLEWYRENADEQTIMQELEEYILFLGKHMQTPCKFPKVWQSLSLEKLFSQIGVNYQKLLTDHDYLYTLAYNRKYNTDHASWRELFDQLFVNEIESQLSPHPTFVTDFPSSLSPFCIGRDDKPYIAKRFELYINKIEIANGNEEKTKEVVSNDTDFLSDLKKMKESGKQYAGVGVGLARLLMILQQ